MNRMYVINFALLAMLALPAQAQAQGSAANFAGTYRCSPEPSQCQSPLFSVSQTGNTLEIRAENGPVSEAKITSDITLSVGPPWNSIGVVLPDHSIQWSNGTHWRKQ
jgi:hypothetical protein